MTETSREGRESGPVEVDTAAVGAQIKRAGNIMDRLTATLNASGEFWVEASEIDGGTDVRLSVSDRRNGGPWITVTAETGD